MSGQKTKTRYWAMDDLESESEARSLTGKPSPLLAMSAASTGRRPPSKVSPEEAATALVALPNMDGDKDFDSAEASKATETPTSPPSRWCQSSTLGGKRAAMIAFIGIVALIVVVAVAVPLAVLLPGSRTDRCTFPPVPSDQASPFGLASTATAWACLASIPLAEDVKNNSLTVLQSLNQLYQFTDLAVNSSAPYFIQVDLIAEVAQMAATSYTSDYSFHRAVQRVYNRLFDAHTVYSPPVPYWQFTTVRPFQVTCALVNGSQIVYAAQETNIEGLTYTDLRKRLGVNGPDDLADYLGVPITLINGQPAVAYLVALASNYGMYKDPGVQLNSFLRPTSPASFGVSPYMSDVDESAVSFTFMDGRSLSLNSVVLVLQTWKSTADLISQIRSYSLQTDDKRTTTRSGDPGGATETGTDLRHLLVPESPFELYYQRYVQYLTHDRPRCALCPATGMRSGLEYVGVGDAIPGVVQCGLLQSNDTGNIEAVVLKISSFLPPDASYDLFVQVVVSCRNLSAITGVDALLVDLSGNGGGYVSLAQMAAWAVSPRYRQDLLTTQFEFDVRIPGVPLGPEFIVSPANQSRPCQNASFLPFQDPAGFVPLTRSGRTSSYSPIYSSSELPWESLPAISELFDTLGYVPRVVLITDGTCGSACSMFATSIANDNAGAIVSFGGVDGDPMDTSSFGGGTVEEWTNYVAALSPQLRAQLPASSFITTASARFTSSEFYGPNQGLPREWLRDPAAYHLPVWVTSIDLEDMLALYESVLTAVVPSIPLIPEGPQNICTLPVRDETWKV